MSNWNVLIYVNRAENSEKFWSYSDDNQVAYGRIGSSGRLSQRPDSYIRDKISEKIRKGYKIMAHNVRYYSPAYQTAMNWWDSGSNTPLGGDTPTPTQTREAPAPRTRRRTTTPRVSTPEPTPLPSVNGVEVEKYEVDKNAVDVPKYKTDESGFIKYKSDYDRKKIFDIDVTAIDIIPFRDIASSPRNPRYVSAEQYFSRIPQNSQHDKPATLYDCLNANPTFYLAFIGNECISIYGLHRRFGYCNFLALKTNARIRKTALKKILLKMSNSSNSEYITFKLKTANMRKEIKQIAEYYQEADGTDFKYKRMDLVDGISLPQGIPKRWV